MPRRALECMGVRVYDPDASPPDGELREAP